jgi:hypothetical protein
LNPSVVTITGRLLEIDYRQHSAELWDSEGRMTPIRFSSEQLAEVDAVRRCEVHVVGHFTPDREQTPRVLILESIRVIECADSFWDAPTVSELAMRQGVSPLMDPSEIAADAWVDDDCDEFIAAVRGWRRDA